MPPTRLPCDTDLRMTRNRHCTEDARVDRYPVAQCPVCAVTVTVTVTIVSGRLLDVVVDIRRRHARCPVDSIQCGSGLSIGIDKLVPRRVMAVALLVSCATRMVRITNTETATMISIMRTQPKVSYQLCGLSICWSSINCDKHVHRTSDLGHVGLLCGPADFDIGQ